MTIDELLNDEFDAYEHFTPDQKQVLVFDVQGIVEEDGVSDSEAVRTLARRISPASLDSYVTTLMIAGMKP